jgi:CRP-like cAMP-binding protein
LILEKYNNFEFLKIKEGYFFGERELLFNKDQRTNTIVATKNLELLVLSKKDFYDIFMSKFRNIGADIAGNGYIRNKRVKKIKREAIKFCK